MKRSNWNKKILGALVTMMATGAAYAGPTHVTYIGPEQPHVNDISNSNGHCRLAGVGNNVRTLTASGGHRWSVNSYTYVCSAGEFGTTTYMMRSNTGTTSGDGDMSCRFKISNWPSGFFYHNWHHRVTVEGGIEKEYCFVRNVNNDNTFEVSNYLIPKY